MELVSAPTVSISMEMVTVKAVSILAQLALEEQSLLVSAANLMLFSPMEDVIVKMAFLWTIQETVFQLFAILVV